MNATKAVLPRQPATEGEEWVRLHLEDLRAARFTPRGIVRFLGASLERSEQTRRERPGLTRRARLCSSIGVAVWIGGAATGLEPLRRRIVPGLAWWGATSLMMEWHLGMVETADGRARNLGAADVLTLSRAWLVPVVDDSPTPLLLGAGAASDVLDGILARRSEPTRAGRDLEGLVDTLFSLAALRGLAREDRLGRGPAAAEGARLAVGTIAATTHYFREARPPDARLVRAARSTSVVRFAGVIAASAGHRRLGEALVVAGALASVALTAIRA